MNNRFYSRFDTETYGGRTTDDYRTEFERDRDRLIYCAAFRRLQGKTQVFMSGEYDFYRTRLTHSIEVAQIGRSIANFLNRNSELFTEDYFLDPSLIEVTCLAHDIGHPPFGHGGEHILNQLMSDHGGFEGNAQTLRILTDIFYESRAGRTGMKPTRALMDGVMKYKILEKEMDGRKSKFLYSDQVHCLDFISCGGDFQPAAEHQSIECQIMDWADDTAYSLNDLLDGYKAGFLDRPTIETWADRQDLEPWHLDILECLMNEIHNEADFEVFIANKVGEFIESVSIEQVADYERSNRYNYRLIPDTEHERESQLYKQLAFDVIFQSPQIQQLESKGARIITRLFEALTTRYITKENEYQLLPGKVAENIDAAETDAQKARLICDRIAGMTDAYAIRIYKRIFDPDFGSIVDLI